jgi:hypothetical protein
LRTERGLALGIALVVAMAAGALALGLTGAFPEHDRSGPGITVTARLPRGPTSGVAYRLVPPHLTQADAARIFAAVGVTAPVRRAAGIYFAGRGRGTITRTPLGWFVETRDLAAHDPRGETPTTDTAIAVARQVADPLGIPADLVSSIHRNGSTTRTVAIDRLLGKGTVPPLQWTVVVGPGGALEGVEGFLVGVRRIGRIDVDSAQAVAEKLDTAHPTTSVDDLGLWAITVGTDMTGYTPSFGASLRHVLLGSRAICKPFAFHSKTPDQETTLTFVPGGQACRVRTTRSLIVEAGARMLGAVTVDRGGVGLLVPAYDFKFRAFPAVLGPRDQYLTVAAVDDATLARVAHESR